MNKGLILIMTGLLLFGYGGWSLATVIVDGASPVRVNSTPEDGATYSQISAASIYLQDPNSGIPSAGVTYSDDLSSELLSLVNGTDKDGMWSAGPLPIHGGGNTYSFIFNYIDRAGNADSYGGSFTIYTQLDGTWYINNQAVTPSSVVYSQSPVVDFRFVKSVGLDDAQITCTVTFDPQAPGSITLANSAPGEWTGQKVFPGDGTYGADCVASDGIGSPVTASVLRIGSGRSALAPPTWTEYLFGFMMMAGLAFVYMGLRERE